MYQANLRKYQAYYRQIANGDWVPCTRQQCIGRSYAPNQSWAIDYEEQMFICRLLPTKENREFADGIHVDARRIVRQGEAQTRCVGYCNRKCPISCENCSFNETCAYAFESDIHITCTKKCEACHLFVPRTTPADKPIGYDESGDAIMREFTDNTDPYAEIFDSELLSGLRAFAETLKAQDARLLWLLVARAKKADIAAELGLKIEGVRYRTDVLRKKMRAFKPLRGYLKIF